MTSKRKHRRPIPGWREHRPSARAIGELPSLDDAQGWSNERLAEFDIGAINLLCASGLPGAGELNISELTAWLDDAAEKVYIVTGENYDKLLDAPSAFGNSQARFCMQYLVTVLQRQCGVHYNPKWKGLTPDAPIPRNFGADANDLFIHAIINGIGGTCGSLPVLYVAVGRRLGYPLKVVKAFRHLFVRWDDPAGKHWLQPERFNVEATGPGVHFLPDSHYRTWPHAPSHADIAAGIYLRSLTPREELAELLSARACCLNLNNGMREAIQAMSWAAQLAPHNRHFAESHQALSIRLQMHRRGHAFLNALVPTFGIATPLGPLWIPDGYGHHYLVQVPDRCLCPTACPAGIMHRPLQEHLLQTPGGFPAWVQVPTRGANPEMAAHWLKLSDGNFALVHKPLPRGWMRLRNSSGCRHATASATAQNTNGHPILPESNGPTPHLMSEGQPGLSSYEANQLTSSIEDLIRRSLPGTDTAGLPGIDALALPPGPSPPRLPTTSTIPLRRVH